jgi:hypothetical protein
MYGTPGVFLLDTGAAGSAVDPHFAMAARLHVSRERETITGRGGDIEARRTEPAMLSLVGGPQARIAPVMTDLGEASRAMGVPLAGILGEDFLRGFVLTLDYRDQTVSFATDVADPPDATPIRLGGTPYVQATAILGERKAAGEFEIDTGSNTAVEFWRPFANDGLGQNLGSEAMGLGVAGASVIARGRIDALEVAGRRIAGPEVNFADDTKDDDAGPRYGGVIGGPAWRGLILTLDLPRRRMWLR